MLLIIPCLSLGQTLDESIAHAIKNAPTIEQTKHNTSAAEWQFNANIGALTPTVNLSSNDNKTRSHIIRRATQNRSVSITQPIFSLALLPNIQQSDLALSNTKISQKQAEQNVILDVCTTYLNALSTLNHISLRKQNMQTIRTEIKKVTAELNAGTKTKRDLQFARAELSTNQAALVEATALLKNQILKLQVLTNQDLTNLYTLAKSPRIGMLPSKPKTLAVAQIAAVKQAHNNAIIQDKEYSKSLAGIAPTIALTAKHTRSFDSAEKNTVSLNISLPLSATKTADSLKNRQLAKASYQAWKSEKQLAVLRQTELMNQYDVHEALLLARLEKLEERSQFFYTQKRSLENDIITTEKYLEALENKIAAQLETEQTFFDAWLNHFSALAFRHELSVAAVKPLTALLAKKSEIKS